MQKCTENMKFKVENLPIGTINKTSVFRKNLRKTLKDRKYTIEKFAEIVDMSMGKIQRFQNPLQQGTISLEDAIKVSSTLNISFEEMCGIEHVKFEPRQTRDTTQSTVYPINNFRRQNLWLLERNKMA